ncbi:arginyltransferase [Pseudemcibacter aquimaris]|uniref:arginyltransferase n=1 Tax=Pseudemcibacter aquimaris TaxID=2857064 RepID=UPI002012C687|nr:arginyltransferase [Pseudemcibacter aquimaris]MCC3860585.1 arginyltransferase [Pseudemcibacter aquimaris]WDU59406.1 arginyltransferase [Pseudemcibacter aquimaris]
MTDQSAHFPKFYVTAPSPCPYLEGRTERKIFTELVGPPLAYDKDAIMMHAGPDDTRESAEALHQSLALVGFRRSQDIAYRPACQTCHECKSVRIPIVLFNPSKSQKRVQNKNKDLIISIRPNIATEEQYSLLKKYITSRHSDGGMSEISFEEYKDMVESSPISTMIVEYRLPDGHLVGAALTDVLEDSLSMVYSFFDISEEYNKRSLGVCIVLNHIYLAESRGLDYIYLGYLVKNSKKMGYKENFKPLEILISEGWQLVK